MYYDRKRAIKGALDVCATMRASVCVCVRQCCCFDSTCMCVSLCCPIPVSLSLSLSLCCSNPPLSPSPIIRFAKGEQTPSQAVWHVPSLWQGSFSSRHTSYWLGQALRTEVLFSTRIVLSGSHPNKTVSPVTSPSPLVQPSTHVVATGLCKSLQGNAVCIVLRRVSMNGLIMEAAVPCLGLQGDAAAQ